MSDWNQQIIDEFRANGGDVRTNGFGKGLVLLHHRGAKTGAERVSPVAGIRVDPDTWLAAASKGGAPDNPAWFHNLLAHPDVEIETPDDGIVPVRATQLARRRARRGLGAVHGPVGRIPLLRAAHDAHDPRAAAHAPGRLTHRRTRRTSTGVRHTSGRCTPAARRSSRSSPSRSSSSSSRSRRCSSCGG